MSTLKLINMTMERQKQLKHYLCGKWTTDSNDMITITLNDKSKLIIHVQCSDKRMGNLNGHISTSNNKFLLNYDNLEGNYGELNQEATLKETGTLIWMHDGKELKWRTMKTTLPKLILSTTKTKSSSTIAKTTP